MRYLGTLLVVTLLAVLCLPAVAQNEASEENQPKKTQDMEVNLYVLRLDLNEEYQYGSRTETRELKQVFGKSGVYGVRDLLEEEGELELLLKGNQPGAIGKDLRIFVGLEKPFVTSIETSDDSNRKTTRQSTVQSGTSGRLDITSSDGPSWNVEYDVDFDAAYITEKEDQPLIGRVRINWEGKAVLSKEEPLLVGRFTREIDDKLSEFIFLYEINPREEE